MNTAERLLLKTARKLVYHVFMEEVSKIKNEWEKLETSKYFFDVMNSGVLLDINKLKQIGINNLHKALKKREIKV
jgi:hypothetical protein